MQIHEMESNDAETMSIEEAREMTLAAVREEYAKVWSTLYKDNVLCK